MDGVLLQNPYGSSNDVKPTSPRYAIRSSRLPTPATSGSGYEPFDNADYQNETLDNGPRLYGRSLPPPTDHHDHAPNGSSKRSPSRRDSCNQGSPNSPPYRCVDIERPTLPPLRTVSEYAEPMYALNNYSLWQILADSISSPPSTPNLHHSRSFQLSPKEPTYISSTYRPPALYPHNKQRTGAFVEASPWINQSNRAESPSTFRPPIELRVNTTDGVRRDSFSAPPVQLSMLMPLCEPPIVESLSRCCKKDSWGEILTISL